MERACSLPVGTRCADIVGQNARDEDMSSTRQAKARPTCARANAESTTVRDRKGVLAEPALSGSARRLLESRQALRFRKIVLDHSDAPRRRTPRVTGLEPEDRFAIIAISIIWPRKPINMNRIRTDRL